MLRRLLLGKEIVLGKLLCNLVSFGLKQQNLRFAVCCEVDHVHSEAMPFLAYLDFDLIEVLEGPDG
jgi:hypothetical protein